VGRVTDDPTQRPPAEFRALLARVRASDPSAARELVGAYGPALQREVRGRLADPRLGRTVGENDVVQAVLGNFFVRVALGQYDLEGPEDLLKLWAVMARNKVTSSARKRDVARDGEPFAEGASVDVSPSEPSPVALANLAKLAVEARGRLAPELLQVVTLREEGLSWTEVGQRVGGSPGALRKRLTRVLDDLVESLGVGEGRW